MQITKMVLSIEDQQRMSGNGIERIAIVAAIVMTCGAMASKMTPEYRSIITKKTPDAKIDEIPDGYFISMAKEIFNQENFAQSEIDAVVAHEEGHIVLGHINKIMAAAQEANFEGCNISSDIGLEYEADQYACKKVSKDAMIGALQKIPAAVERLMMKEGMFDLLSQFYEDILPGLEDAIFDRIQKMEEN